jgi:hypothetical protein
LTAINGEENAARRSPHHTRRVESELNSTHKSPERTSGVKCSFKSASNDSQMGSKSQLQPPRSDHAKSDLERPRPAGSKCRNRRDFHFAAIPIEQDTSSRQMARSSDESEEILNYSNEQDWKLSRFDHACAAGRIGFHLSTSSRQLVSSEW